MNASLPRERGSGASPIPPLFCFSPSFPSSWAQAKKDLYYPYPIPSSIYRSQIAAQNAIPVQNVIRYYTTLSIVKSLHYIYTSVCCMSVSVYVYVTPTWHCWLPFFNILLLYPFSKSLNALFFFVLAM